jgi:hypothetical protein
VGPELIDNGLSIKIRMSAFRQQHFRLFLLWCCLGSLKVTRKIVGPDRSSLYHIAHCFDAEISRATTHLKGHLVACMCLVVYHEGNQGCHGPRRQTY